MPVLVLCISVLTTTALAQSAPLYISGHVTVNGEAAAGVSVSAGSSHSTTDSSGFYQLSPSVSNGSGVTVTANYQGHQQSKTVTQNMQGGTTADLAITYSTATATPHPSTSSPSSGGNGGSGGNVGSAGSLGYVTITPLPMPEANDSNSDMAAVTITPTVTPTIMPTATPTPTPVPTPTATAVPVSGQDSSFPWWLVALLGALGVIVVAAYFLLLRKH